MKRVLLFIICLFSLSVVNAKEYVINDTDLSVELSDKWVIFTKENYTDNSLKKKAGIPEETDVKAIFEKDKIIVDALYHEGNILFEFFVSEDKIDYAINMNNIKDEDLNDSIDSAYKAIKEEYTIKDYGVYNNGKYKFIRFDYIGGGWRIYYYTTFINGKVYRIYVRYPETQKSNLVNEKEIIDSVKFNVDESLEETYYKLLEGTNTEEEEEDIEPLLTKDDIKDILVKTFKDTSRDLLIYGAGVVVLVGVVILIVKLKDKKKFKSKNKEFWDN